MTPVCNPTSEGEESYNRAHILTRGIIERTFGLLKSRFRCLDRSGGALLYWPNKVCQIVVVCSILHNIATRAGVPVDEQDTHADAGDDADLEEIPPLDIREQGRDVRLNLISNYFD